MWNIYISCDKSVKCILYSCLVAYVFVMHMAIVRFQRTCEGRWCDLEVVNCGKTVNHTSILLNHNINSKYVHKINLIINLQISSSFIWTLPVTDISYCSWLKGTGSSHKKGAIASRKSMDDLPPKIITWKKHGLSRTMLFSSNFLAAFQWHSWPAAVEYWA